MGTLVEWVCNTFFVVHQVDEMERSLGKDHKNRGPVSRGIWRDKDFTLLTDPNRQKHAYTYSLSQDKLKSLIREILSRKTVNSIQSINLPREISLCQRMKRAGVTKHSNDHTPPPIAFTARENVTMNFYHIGQTDNEGIIFHWMMSLGSRFRCKLSTS